MANARMIAAADPEYEGQDWVDAQAIAAFQSPAERLKAPVALVALATGRGLVELALI